MPQIPSYERYGRQMLLPDIGFTGQQRLLATRVAVVGAGGLGCPALQYLAAAGVGTIGIFDFDTVSISNLHRQVLYQTDMVGQSKALCAQSVLQAMNPEIMVQAHPVQLTAQNALDLLSDYDLVLDATDNFPARYLINDACVLLGKPLVWGAVNRFEGQVAFFNHTDADGQVSANYRDLFPTPPPAGTVLSCAEAGVLGVLPGIIGAMQATEVIKWITGAGKLLVNQLLTYHALNNTFFTLRIRAQAGSRAYIPATTAEFRAMDYGRECGIGELGN